MQHGFAAPSTHSGPVAPHSVCLSHCGEWPEYWPGEQQVLGFSCITDSDRLISHVHSRWVIPDEKLFLPGDSLIRPGLPKYVKQASLIVKPSASIDNDYHQEKSGDAGLIKPWLCWLTPLIEILVVADYGISWSP